MYSYILLFLVIFIMITHLLFQWKISNSVDISHIEVTTKNTLELVANNHVPFIFEKSLNTTLCLDNMVEKVNIQLQDQEPISVSHKAMLCSVKKSAYISQNNSEFVKSSGLLHSLKTIGDLDTFLTPPMKLYSYYDIMYGNLGVYTQLYYSKNDRNYICILEGSVNIKLCTPNSVSHLSKSSINIWSPNTEDSIVLQECETILLTLSKGSILHIPAHWMYSIQFSEFACVMSFSYSTFMNAFSKLPKLCINYTKKKLNNI